MEAQGFVSKNGRREKAGRKTASPKGMWTVIYYCTAEMAANKASEPSLVRHFTACQSPLYQLCGAVSARFMLLFGRPRGFRTARETMKKQH
jgi:hypothetical protein